MPFTVTKYPHGTFCWADVQSKDVDKTKTFLTQLFDWTFEDMPTPQGPVYTMFSKDGKEVAAASPMQPNMPKDMPSFWSNYINVNDVDAVLVKVKELGGVVYMPPKDIAVGKIGIVADPTGAGMCLIELSKVPPQEWVE